MNGLRARAATAFGGAGLVLSVVSAVILAVWLLLGLGVLVRWAKPPPRHATGPVELATYGAPGIVLRLTYPTRLEPRAVPTAEQAVTVSAVAETADDVQSLVLALPLEGDAAYFTDAQGHPIAGRLEIVPGYPDPLPYTLYLVHGNTQVRGGLLLPRTVQITPALLLQQGPVAVPALTLQVSIRGRVTASLTQALTSLDAVILPYVVVLSGGLVAAWVSAYLSRRRQAEHQQRLQDLYHRLEECMRLGQWPDARQAVETIRLIEPGYRDVPLLEGRIRCEEDARWRKERLFRRGVEAYRQREWREAARALAEVEAEDPYFRDVGYLHRTAALYADLSSRDRSRRAAAALQLGEVGDLVTWEPLLDALGDPSGRVADAAEHAFRDIGAQALDVLLGGLAHPSEEVRSRSFGLIKGFGQAVRNALEGALRSSDVRLSCQAAALLHAAGGRGELAEALLWADETHMPGIVTALAGEGVAATSALLDVLQRAPQDRVGVVLRVVAALKARADISRPLEEALRNARDAEARARLDRAVQVPPGPFVAGEEPSAPAEEPEPAEERALAASQGPQGRQEPSEGLDGVRRQIRRLFDRPTS